MIPIGTVIPPHYRRDAAVLFRPIYFLELIFVFAHAYPVSVNCANRRNSRESERADSTRVPFQDSANRWNHAFSLATGSVLTVCSVLDTVSSFWTVRTARTDSNAALRLSGVEPAQRLFPACRAASTRCCGLSLERERLPSSDITAEIVDCFIGGLIAGNVPWHTVC